MQGRKVFSKKGMQGSCWLCGTNSSHDHIKVSYEHAWTSKKAQPGFCFFSVLWDPLDEVQCVLFSSNA